MQKADQGTLDFLQELRKVRRERCLFSDSKCFVGMSTSLSSPKGLKCFQTHVRLALLVQYLKVGIVGGSDQVKICEQLGENGKSITWP